MRNKQNILILVFSLLLISMQGVGQNNTSSPYSRFGIGDLAPQGFGRNNAMGGTGIALRSNRTLNNINPASFSALDSMSFIMEFGVQAVFSKFKTNLQENTQDNTDINFDYLSFAFPINRWWGTSFGVARLSDVGYKIQNLENNEQTGDILYNYRGSGGLNRAYISNGITPLPNLSLGITMNYVFGSLDQDKTVNINSFNTSTIFTTEKSQIRDFAFDFGAQYHGKISPRHDMVIGAIYSNKTSLSTDYSNTVLKSSLTMNNTAIKTDTLFNSTEKQIIDLPQTYGIGFAVTSDKKLTLAIDYRHQNWSDTDFLGQRDSLVNSNNFALGMEYTPNANSIRNYFQRVSYRLGGHYTNSYLKIRGEQLKDYGISFGAGFPLRRSATYITITAEIGRRGTLAKDLIRENYAKIGVNFSLFEHWFVKRKYD